MSDEIIDIKLSKKEWVLSSVFGLFAITMFYKVLGL